MKKVLVTGASGQLGRCFRKMENEFPNLDITFTSAEELDLTLFGMVDTFIKDHNFDYCINCAAYTNVEQAETSREMAFLINSEAVRNLAQACAENATCLIHFSTDYVFDGKKETPYSEEDETNPINVYGSSKLSGEHYIQQKLDKFFIFRTSWLYSNIGHNFFNTIRKKLKSGAVCNITSAQKGTPTNAYDLAAYILNIISSEEKHYGIYHYSNLGEATWYDFAQEIIHLSGKTEEVRLIENNDFETVAERPANSVLSKEKAMSTFSGEIPHWKESLAQLFKNGIS
ncbi:dTDP-4-dehydrorhamnose reductase [Salinimicrobium sp. GXAS 041]|uniref:dTDP-4-dehydrorhamnose reductase n=1 Tax=Salinimicrobium sp. GXAS 041 TaxID=3400806 RepID=UPI003C76B42C